MSTTVEPSEPAAATDRRLLEPFLATLALGALADALLRDGIVGAGAALWTAALLAALVTLARRRGRPVTVCAALLTGLALLLGAALAWHDSPPLLLLDLAALATTFCALGGALALGDELPVERAGPVDYLRGVLASFPSLAAGAPTLARDAGRAALQGDAPAISGARRAAVLVAARGTGRSSPSPPSSSSAPSSSPPTRRSPASSASWGASTRSSR